MCLQMRVIAHMKLSFPTQLTQICVACGAFCSISSRIRAKNARIPVDRSSCLERFCVSLEIAAFSMPLATGHAQLLLFSVLTLSIFSFLFGPLSFWMLQSISEVMRYSTHSQCRDMSHHSEGYFRLDTAGIHRATGTTKNHKEQR